MKADLFQVSFIKNIFYKNYYYKNIIIYVWLHWVFDAVHRLSLVVVSRATLELWCVGSSLHWLLSLRSTGSVDVTRRLSCL